MPSTPITLITREQVKIKKTKSILRSIFTFFDDHCNDLPNVDTIELELGLEEWVLIDVFTTTLNIPDNREDWIKLIATADYLNLVPRYSSVLRKEAKKFALAHGATIKDPKKITLCDIGKKIADPTYLLPSEQSFCEYIFTRGARMGQQCGAKAVPGEKFCSSCSKKKVVMSRSSAQAPLFPEPKQDIRGPAIEQ